MKKRLFSLILISCCSVFCLKAQVNLNPPGMNFQAQARDAKGQPLSSKTVSLKVSLTATGDQSVLYQEIHEIKTDPLGLFNLVIGGGKEVRGKLGEVPFSKVQIWLNIGLDPSGGRNFNLVQSAELFSVPYAFHAATASQLVENSTELDLPNEKNQSIYWTTAGNTNTRPPTHFIGTRDSQDLVFKTDNTTRMIITAAGQIKTFSTCVDNGDQDTTSYSIVAQGCKQGVYIKVNGKRSGDNNFVTFADEENIWGRIEGQTTGELFSSFDYLFQNTIFGINTASMALNLTGLAGEVVVVAAQILTLAEVVPIALQARVVDTRFAVLIAEWIGYNVNKLTNVGVTYESGAGDYAEWLERVPGEPDLKASEVVGVKGGRVSRNTQDADHFMVVSNRPIVLGNMPRPGSESSFEKIAFLGQVPVRVVGKVEIGDYLLPSGSNDGFAVAVHPSKMVLADYRRIIGVAWEAAKDAPINIVNIAVGLNKNDLSPELEKFEQELASTNQKVDQILAYLEGKASSLPQKTVPGLASIPTTPPSSSTGLQKLLSDEEFDLLLDKHSSLLISNFSQIGQELINKGYKTEQIPLLQALFQNPIGTLKQMRRDPNQLSHWGLFDQQMMQKK